MDVGVPELLIVLAVVLLVFGSTRVPKLARALGEASREFRRGANDRGGDPGGGPDTGTGEPG